MDKLQIKEHLQEIGIMTDNCYPKSSFPYNGDIHVGLYEREMKDDFYFYNKYDKKLYRYNAGTNVYDMDAGSQKFMIPLKECDVVWEDIPYVELPDVPFREMTLRHYVCIHRGVPETGLPWLDELIKKKEVGYIQK